MSSVLRKKKKKMEPKFYSPNEIDKMRGIGQTMNLNKIIITNTFHALRAVAYLVLHDKFGFGTRRMKKFEETVANYYKMYESDKLSPDELCFILNKKWEINVPKVCSKVPFMDKLHIAGAELPKTKEKAVSASYIIQGAFEAWYILACTALKTQFKLTRKQVNEFMNYSNFVVSCLRDKKTHLTVKDMEDVIKEECKLTLVA